MVADAEVPMREGTLSPEACRAGTTRGNSARVSTALSKEWR